MRSRRAAEQRGISRFREVSDCVRGTGTGPAISSEKSPRLNRIRRANPALQSHLGVTFLTAHNDHILFFEKATPSARQRGARRHQSRSVQRSRAPTWSFRGPRLPDWRLHDHAALDVVDQMTGARFEWHGRWQHMRLDPGAMPFAIWRIAPLADCRRARQRRRRKRQPCRRWLPTPDRRCVMKRDDPTESTSQAHTAAR